MRAIICWMWTAISMGFKSVKTHDYTRKGGVVHAEIMLPAHAPPEFADRSTLWNSVEQIEKARDSQLAREIEAALPRELSREQQLALVRAYVKDNFVNKGMCADFAIHDKGIGNPHVHIMLTVRPLKENGAWGAKCRKAYDLDENGQRIPDGKGGWKNHREDTTDWNDKGNVEIWRAAWAAYVWLAISIDPVYIDTGNWIESAAGLCYECLNDIALDVFGMTGNDHDFEDADPLELAEIKRRWKPYIDQLPEYAYLCDELLSGRK